MKKLGLILFTFLFLLFILPSKIFAGLDDLQKCDQAIVPKFIYNCDEKVEYDCSTKKVTNIGESSQLACANSGGCYYLARRVVGSTSIYYCIQPKNVCPDKSQTYHCQNRQDGYVCSCMKEISAKDEDDCSNQCLKNGADNAEWVNYSICRCIFSSNQISKPQTITVAKCCVNDICGIKTIIGCVPTDTTNFIGWLLKWGISIGSGVAFLLMTIASFKLMTSSGNPEAIKDGKEMFISSGAGLLLIILSMFLLRLIGVEILQIPGFN